MVAGKGGFAPTETDPNGMLLSVKSELGGIVRKVFSLGSMTKMRKN